MRNVCENEEQRLLEKVHAEEERTHQSILTQRAHWSASLQKLDTLRTYLVDMITNLDDHGLVVSTTALCGGTGLACSQASLAVADDS